MKNIVTYESNISSTGWLENELKHVDFKDKRLVDRLIKTSNFLDSKASGTINQSCGSWGKMRRELTDYLAMISLI